MFGTKLFGTKFWSLVAIVLLLAGCGSGAEESEYRLAPVSGTVTLDGQPLAGATVMFSPTDVGIGQTSYGVTDAQGNYSLTDPQQRDGVAVGTHKIVVSKLVQPDGSPIPSGASAADIGAVEQLPPKYSDPETSQTIVTVPEAGKTFDVSLTSK